MVEGDGEGTLAHLVVCAVLDHVPAHKMFTFTYKNTPITRGWEFIKEKTKTRKKENTHENTQSYKKAINNRNRSIKMIYVKI